MEIVRNTLKMYESSFSSILTKQNSAECFVLIPRDLETFLLVP